MKKLIIFLLVFVLLAGFVSATSYPTLCDPGAFCYDLAAGGDPAINGSNATAGELLIFYGWSSETIGQFNYSDKLVANGTMAMLSDANPTNDQRAYYNVTPGPIDYPVTWEVYIFDDDDISKNSQFGFFDGAAYNSRGYVQTTNDVWKFGLNGTRIIFIPTNPSSKQWLRFTVEFSPSTHYKIRVNNGTWYNTSTTDATLVRLNAYTNQGNNISIDSFRLWNGTIDDDPMDAVASTGVDAPTWVYPTPPDGGTDNTVQVFNASCDELEQNTKFLWFDTNPNPITLVVSNLTQGNYSPAELTPAATYYYRAACYNNSLGAGTFSANTTIRSFTFDNLPPTFLTTLDGNNTLVFDNLTWSFNITDDLTIAGWNLTLDGIFFNETKINQAFYIGNYSWDVGFNSTGNHTIHLEACDAHTAAAINDFAITKDNGDKSLTYDSGITIRPKYDNKFSQYNTKKLIDRYSFEYTPNKLDGTYTFVVEATGTITIMNSQYQGHLVIFDQAKWVDFESEDSSIVVTGIKRISSTKVEVTVANPNNKKMLFNSIGGLNCAVVDLLYYKYGEDHIYAAQTLPNQQEDFTLRINLTGTPFTSVNVSAVLIYNNTKFSPTKSGTNLIDFDVTLTTPEIPGPSATTKIFRWEYNITGNVFNSTSQSQTLGNIFLTECSDTYTVHTLNISVLNATDTTKFVSVDLEQTYQVFDSLGTPTLSFNFTNTTIANFSLCIFPNATITTDFQIDYTYGTTKFSYFGFQINLSNATKTLDLYVVDDTSQINYHVVDNVEDDVEDVYITVEQYDVGTNSFKVVELLKTDSDGNAIGRAVLFTEWYRFTLSVDGVVKLIQGPLKLISNEKEFKISLAGADWTSHWDMFQGIATAIGWNNDTQRFHVNYTDSQLVLNQICLKVTNTSMKGNTVLYENCDTSPGASGQLISTPIGGSVDNQVFVANSWVVISGSGNDLFYVGTLIKDFMQKFNIFGDKAQSMGTYVAMLLVIAMAFVFIWNPQMSIIGVLLGLGAMRIFGFIDMNWVVYITLVVMGVIFIWRINAAK